MAAAPANEIRFVLNGRARRVRPAAALVTALDHIRLAENLSGTKEGCGEGDCGACTVVVCDRDAAGAMRVRAVNSCLVFLPMLDGKYVLTVEGLAEAGGALNPVQAAMVAEHGSQCGYCTPGFVMALTAFGAGGEAASDDAVHDALAGNLCRCTGYRPIVAAAKAAQGAMPAWWQARRGEIEAALDTLRRDAPLSVEAGDARYDAPATVAELAGLLARHPESTLVAGATDLALGVTKHRQRPRRIVSLAGIPELRRIEVTADALRIGAAASHSDVLPVVEPLYPGFGTLLRRFGSRQIRHLGTLGGNLGTASPIGDLPPVLLALDATVHIGSAAGARDVPVGEFFPAYRRTALKPGEFIAAVTLPRLGAGDFFGVHKLSKRYDQDISTLCAALHLRLAEGRIVEARLGLGGMAATPIRAKNAEAALTGRQFDAAAAEAAIAALDRDVAPISDLRGSADYRRRAAANLIRRFRLEYAGVPYAAAVTAL